MGLKNIRELPLYLQAEVREMRLDDHGKKLGEGLTFIRGHGGYGKSGVTLMSMIIIYAL